VENPDSSEGWGPVGWQDGTGKSRVISGGNPVLVLVMYWLRAFTMVGSFLMELSSSRLMSSFRRRSWARE